MGDRYTIVGGRGFIGRALSEGLSARGHAVTTRTHLEMHPGTSHGHVIYASGIAGAAANDPAYAYDAHIDGVRRILESETFDSFLFLSSARVYGHSDATSEAAPLALEPNGGRDLYRITKVAGEARVLAHPSPVVRVVRLSNVTGNSFQSSLFLSDVLRQAATNGRVAVRTTRLSAKDYISISDVCRYLEAVAVSGRERVYNVAVGRNIENGTIYDMLEANGVTVDIAPDAIDVILPALDVRRLQAEFGPAREDVQTLLPSLLAAFRTHFAVRAAT